uniref:Putative RxLR effector n=1 Tax=Plasmopara viticola TaxID=143451 RepID=A0A650F4Q3_PLAVT|nr:putative RxLR effector [Plasmopara viticola]
MRGTYFVAIALLVAAGSQTAAEFNQDECQQAHGNDSMASANTIDEIFQSRVLRVSRKSRDDDFTLSAGNEERAPTALSDFIKMVKVPDSIVTVADGMRTEREASLIGAASKNLINLRSNERQRFTLTPNDVVGQGVRTLPDPDESPVLIGNDIRLDLAKRQKGKRPTAIMEPAVESVTQHDYRLTPSDPSTINAKAPNDRLYKQLISQNALQLDKSKHFDGAENLWEENSVSFDLLYLFEESAYPKLKRQEASGIKAASKDLIQLESKKRDRNRIFSTPNNVVEQAVHAPLDPDKFPMSIANDKPLVSNKSRKRKSSTFIMENAALFAKQDDYRPGPSHSSTTNAKAFNDRHANQLITQKTLRIDKHKRGDIVESSKGMNFVSVNRLLHMFEEFNKVAHPTAVNRQEASAIEAAAMNLNQLESDTHQRIAPTPKLKVGQAVHAPPETSKPHVLVADDIPSTLAQRLKTEPPTAIMNNAARFLATHDFRPVPPGSSAISVESPNGRLNNQPITQEALQLDKNEHVDDGENLRNENSQTVDHLSHLREGNDKSLHFTAVNRQSEPIDWTDDLALGPRSRYKILITEQEKKVHLAFLGAFNLPFHQYPRETATMLSVVRWGRNSTPNNALAIETLKSLTKKKGLEKLQELLKSDLEKLLKDGDMMLPLTLENLKEAYHVKLVIMYDLFYKFCHDRNDLVENLSPKSWPNNWILQPFHYNPSRYPRHKMLQSR